jgi:radical SAM protein with 4Fe4S-binding SPASM domain
VNVYQSVRTDVYALSYQEYWEGFKQLLAQTYLIAAGEPLMRAMLGLPQSERRCGCGVGTVRVTPRATTQPCVYWPGAGEPLANLLNAGEQIIETAAFVAARTLPKACEPCQFRECCHGGCAGRRRLQGALDQPDFYCPIVRGERPVIEYQMAPSRDLPKMGSACTTVVIARD